MALFGRLLQSNRWQTFIRLLYRGSVIIGCISGTITEKSMDQTNASKYTFAVADSANKMQIKAAVEELFKVTVTDVHTMVVRGKKKRLVGNFAIEILGKRANVDGFVLGPSFDSNFYQYTTK